MSPVTKRILDASRRRSIPSTGFSWIDRGFVRDGFLLELTAQEALLYFFLIAVGDRDGLSYFGDRRTARLLKLTEEQIERARQGLQRHDLIRYRSPLYQVLSLPDRPLGPGLSAVTLPASSPPTTPIAGPRTLGDTLRDIL